MPLFSSRPRADGVDGILQIISMGDCDDHTIKQLQVLIESMSDDDVKSLADALMTNLVKYPDDIDVLTGSVKGLETLPYMPKAKNEFIITLLLSLLKAPVNKKDALQRKTLKSEVVKFLLFFVVQDDAYARLMMTELISALDDTHGAISSSVFHTLQRLATEKPEYFEHYSAALIKQLGSINKVTRAESAKLIGLIARTHPEYVCKALPFLQSLASFYPDAHVKRNANEAYQIIWRSMKKESQAPAAARKVDDEGKGFADIVKLNTGPSGSSMPEVQFTDDELKEIIELTRKEFKSDAEAILNSLGVGHLAVKGKEGRKKASPPRAEAEPQARPKKEEKAFVTPQSGIANAIKRDAREAEAPKASRPKAAGLEPARPKNAVPPEKPAKEEKASAMPPDIVDSLIKEVRAVEAPKAPRPKVVLPEKPAKEEKAVATPPLRFVDSILNELNEPVTPKAPRPKAVLPEKPAKASATPPSGIVDSIMKEVTEPDLQKPPVKAKGDPKAGRVFKCPKCGKHVWAEGQLCNSCGAEEFDAMRLKGHYDVGS